MKYAKLNPLQTSLPDVGQLSTGEWVSNYYLLPADILAAEGWLPLEEVYPEYDVETHYMEQDTITEVNGKIVITYKATPYPPNEIDVLLSELEELV